MVRGIGVDIIEISRIRQSIESAGDGFLEKVFTPREIEYCKSKQNMHQHFAARFAAKEAVGKALSTGWRGEFRWKNVEVMNDASGQPRITLHDTLKDHLAGAMIFVSLSHSESHVVAMVVIEEKDV
ncbi:MAG: acpS [Bacteroidetes bacterium]|nr:acpS [Bacteroidota bacterium]